MPTIINNLLHRRGRKGVNETNLDSTYGDIRISSPTETAQLWPNKEPDVNVNAIQSELLALTHDTHLRNGSIGSVLASTAANQVNIPRDYATTHNHNHSPTYGAQGTGSALLPSPPHLTTMIPTGYSSPESLAHHPANLQINVDKVCQHKDHHHNFLAACGGVAQVHGIMTPTTATEENFGDCRMTAPHSQAQIEASQMYDSHTSRRIAESSNLIRRPKWVDKSQQENQTMSKQHQFPGLNATAFERMSSPGVTMLSPVSEVFPTDEHAAGDKDIMTAKPIAYDVASLRQPELSLSAHSTISSECKAFQALGISGVSFPVQHTPSQDPTSPQSAGLYNRTSPPIQGSTDLSKQDMFDAYRFDRMFPNSAASPSIDNISTLPSTTPSMRYRSPLSGHMESNRSQTQSPSSVTSRVQSPPMGVTGLMRMKSPPLGVTGMMRVQSPPMDVDGSSRTHSRDPSIESINVARANASMANDFVVKFQRQRSASLEPPPSPSIWEAIAPKPSPVPHPTLHRRMHSANSIERQEGIAKEYDQTESNLVNYTTTANHARSQMHYDPSLISKRTRSHTPLVSPDFHKRPAINQSPGLPSDEHNQTSSKRQDFYKEVEDDYRKVHHEAQEANQEQSRIASQSTKPTQNDKRRLYSRAVSASRARARSASRHREPPGDCRLLSDESNIAGPQHALVPSYDDLWA